MNITTYLELHETASTFIMDSILFVSIRDQSGVHEEELMQKILDIRMELCSILDETFKSRK